MPLFSFLAGVEETRRNAGWFTGLGIALLVMGLVSLGAAWFVTLATILFFGWMLLFGGLVEVVSSFGARKWNGFFMHLLAGVLYGVVGAMVISNPVATAGGITLLLASLFFIGGAFRIISAAVLRYPKWGWTILDGAIAIALGFLIFNHWPSSAVWVIGTFVGVDLVFRGIAWMMLGRAARKLPTIEEKLIEPADYEHISSR